MNSPQTLSCGPASRSIRTTRRPARASRTARADPAGPPPTIRASALTAHPRDAQAEGEPGLDPRLAHASLRQQHRPILRTEGAGDRHRAVVPDEAVPHHQAREQAEAPEAERMSEQVIDKP